MLPSDINLNIRSGTTGYNNKFLVSDGNFSLGENDKVNTFELAKEGGNKPKIIHNVVVQPTITHKTSAYEEEKVAFGPLTHWRLYYVVYVSINRSLRPVNKI